MLGDSSRMFANSFFVKADEYYHSGYYPTIFDNNEAFKTPHLAEDTGAVNSKNHGDEAGFMGPPRDWIDAFERHFIPNRHTHLDEGGPTDDLSTSDKVGEILPWLKLSAELDPENVQTYTVTAYWLRRMHKDNEAEIVLREGLLNNPDSYEILFELGRLYHESYHETDRARGVWELAVKRWHQQEDNQKEPDFYALHDIATELGHMEDDTGNYSSAIKWLKIAQAHAPNPYAVQKQIDDIKKKMAVQSSVSPANSAH